MTNKRKLDRRVLRTRQALKDALNSLVLEKGYEAVTIEEITERANVGRTTFYLHYRDKEDLLMRSIEELVEDLVTQMARIPLHASLLQGEAGLSAPPLAQTLTLPYLHVAHNSDLYRIILRGEGTYSATRRLREIITEAIEIMITTVLEREQLESNPLVPRPVLLSHLAGAWLGQMDWWLEHDMPYPPEQMATMFRTMLMRSFREVLGVKLPTVSEPVT